jgi:hypothetical protein
MNAVDSVQEVQNGDIPTEPANQDLNHLNRSNYSDVKMFEIPAEINELSHEIQEHLLNPNQNP